MTIEKLTPEIIEACMDREAVEILRPDEEILEGDVWAEVQAFNTCVVSSEKIRIKFFDIARALYDPQAKSDDTQATVYFSMKALVESGKLTDRQVAIIEQVCRSFFFHGWHARGAVEEAEQLKRMAG